MNFVDSFHSSSCCLSRGDWKFVWHLRVVPRIQHFIWRCLNNIVATNLNLYRRKKAISSVCPVCNKEDESLEHLFFQCKWTRSVLFGSSFSTRMDAVMVTNFNRWWLQVVDPMNQVDKYVIAKLCCTLWFIWKGRNAKVFETIDPNPKMVIERATRCNVDYWTTNVVCTVNEELNDKPSFIWSPPPKGFIKINTDASFKHPYQSASIGVVCRDEFCRFQWGFNDKIKSVSSFMSEALALKRALMLAVDLEHDKVMFESDAQLLVKSINEGKPDLHDWKCRSIIQEIIDLMASYVGFSVNYLPRDGNVAADCLATETYKEVYPVRWVFQPSPLLLSFLTNDAKKTGSYSSGCFSCTEKGSWIVLLDISRYLFYFSLLFLCCLFC